MLGVAARGRLSALDAVCASLQMCCRRFTLATSPASHWSSTAFESDQETTSRLASGALASTTSTPARFHIPQSRSFATGGRARLSASTPPSSALSSPTHITSSTPLPWTAALLPAGDPGTTRYTAPRMLPGHLHAGIHPVLLSDPWPHADDVETRSRDARAIMAWLHANAPAGGTANQVFLGMQAAAQAADSDAAAAVSAGRASSSDNTSTSPATAAAAAPPRLFASEGYVRGLLERLRLDRFLQSKLNVAERTINPAARDYPRLYVPLLDQVAKFGRPRDIARRTRQRDETVMTRALKRLRNGKPPFPIFRRTAVSSRFHYEVALEAARAHTAAAQAAVAQWQGQAQGGVAPAGQEARKPAA